MARPPKLNAEWFTHAADLRNDRRVKAIRTATGPAGYGILHMLLEALTDADNTTFSVDEFEVELLAGDFGTTAEEIAAVLSIGKKVGYFQVDAAQMLICPELNKWLEMHFDKRNRSKIRGSGDSLSQPVTETPVSVTEIPHNTIHNSTVHNSTVDTTSSLRSEDAATAAAAPEKKIEPANPEPLPPESLPIAPHTKGGAADVGTRKPKAAKPPKAPPGSSDPADYQLPEWAGIEFSEDLREWLTRRQGRTDCKPLQAASIQEYLTELAGYTPEFCQSIFRKSRQNPNWKGLTFDDTPAAFAQHVSKLQQLQANANRFNQPERGAKPTEAASYGARALSAQLRAIREERRTQNGSYVDTGAAAGADAGLGPAIPPGVGAPQG